MPSTTPVTATATRGFSTPSTTVSTVVAVMLTGMNAKTGHAWKCTDECSEWSGDGYCDDGGVESESSYCSYGDDCSDCGIRCANGMTVPPADMCETGTPMCETGTPMCENDCSHWMYEWNGVCNELESECSTGNDCADCGLQCIGGVRVDSATACNETPGSVIVECPNAFHFVATVESGCVITKCDPGYHVRTGGEFCDQNTEGVCIKEGPDECLWRDDGICDDGGHDSEYNVCAWGSDCWDCGARCGDPNQIGDPDAGIPCVLCGNAKEPNSTYDGCISCSRPNATQFADAPGCVITQCEPGYYLRTGGEFCDPHPEGPGCEHTCDSGDPWRADNGICEDGGDNAIFWEKCDYGTDCGDCGIRCDPGQVVGPAGSGQCVLSCASNAEEPTPANDACVPCVRPKATHFADAPGCVITQCEPGYYLRTNGKFCDPHPEGPGCEHTCWSTDNGVCEDGGPESDYADCEYGSDCGDCGVRCGDDVIVDPASGQCLYSCANAEEPNLAYDACIPCDRHNAMQFADAPGCVITQCEPGYHVRTHGQFCDRIQEGPGCGHTCRRRHSHSNGTDSSSHVNNGVCEDGGPDSVSSDCEYGTDCEDCGERETLDCPSKSEFRHNSTAAWCERCQRDNAVEFADVAGSCVISVCVEGYHLNGNASSCDKYKEGHGCNNECRYSRDGYCDDGSDGSSADCRLGTDCEDCGLQCGQGHEEHEGACVDPTSRGVGNANRDDEGFNPVWLAFLAVPALVFVGAGVFCAMNRKAKDADRVNDRNIGQEGLLPEGEEADDAVEAGVQPTAVESEANPPLDGNQTESQIDL